MQTLHTTPDETYSELTVILYPETVLARALAAVLTLLFDQEKVAPKICTSRDDLVSVVYEASNHSYEWYNCDVVVLNSPSPSEVFELNLILRYRNSTSSNGWAGQLIVLSRDKETSDQLKSMPPFSQLGGLDAITLDGSAIFSLIRSLLERRCCLFPSIWLDFLTNLNDLKDFWREIEGANAHFVDSRIGQARTRLRNAVTALISNPDNERFLGHERFRFLQTVAKFSSTTTESIEPLIKQLNDSMKPFQIMTVVEEEKA
jgi:hypothetical protein